MIQLKVFMKIIEIRLKWLIGLMADSFKTFRLQVELIPRELQ